MRRSLAVAVMVMCVLVAGCTAPLQGPGGLVSGVPIVSGEPSSGPTTTPASSARATVTAGSGRWLFMGDLFFGRYINDWSMASPLKYAYPFQNLGQFNRDAYTSWVGNFECPAISGLVTTSAQDEATLMFHCDPNYVPEVAKWFSAVSLGNNHSGNHGDAGFAETQQHLAANGIQYFGAPDPTGQNCNVVTLDVNVALSDGSTKSWPIPFGFCGYDGIFKLPTPAQVGQITTYASILPTIAWPHSGLEYKAGPDAMKVALYRSMIDAGAEMVIGNHAHWVQNSEAYKGKLIVYSMGNFIFDQQGTAEVTRSAMPDISFSVANPDALPGWAAIADKCANDFVTCQTLATANHLPKLQLKYQFAVQGSNDGNKLVKPATPDQLTSIKQRLNWDATMAALGQQ